jgi:hypothetical protein
MAEKELVQIKNLLLQRRKRHFLVISAASAPSVHIPGIDIYIAKRLFGSTSRTVSYYMAYEGHVSPKWVQMRSEQITNFRL